MDTIIDWFELLAELSAVPSAVLPFTSLSSFISLHFFVRVFAGTSHLVCTSIIISDGTLVFFFLERTKSTTDDWGLFMRPLSCLDSNSNTRKNIKVLLLSCSSTFPASRFNECGRYWLTHSCPAVRQCPSTDNSSPIQMRDGIGRQLQT